MIKQRKAGAWAWIGLATYVSVYDYFAIKSNKETLSAAFGRAMENKRYRPYTVFIVILLLKHLMFPNFLPKTDPLGYLAGKWRKGVELAIDV